MELGSRGALGNAIESLKNLCRLRLSVPVNAKPQAATLDVSRGRCTIPREGVTMTSGEAWRSGPVAVLVSGGPDSAILVGELAATSPRVVPVYGQFGMVWDG